MAKSKNPMDSFIQISRDHPNFTVFPFFQSKEDIAMLTKANSLGYSIWGIDQEFQMSFPYCLNKVYQSQSINIKARYKGVYDSLKKKWWSPDFELLDSLKKVLKQPAYKDILESIKTSVKIYSEDDNVLRVSEMKGNFFNYYNAVKNTNEKVFFKMGNNHLAKGLNLETSVYDIGNAAFELTQRNKTNYTNVYFMVDIRKRKG